MEARNLAPLSASVDHTLAAALPISGLTAWQGLFQHGQLGVGQTVLIHGAAGSVGSIAVQLAREAGARVMGTGRAAQRDMVLGHRQVDAAFDVIGGEVLDRSAQLVRPGGILVSIAEPPRVRPADARAVFFVVEPDRTQLAALELRVRNGRLRPIVGAIVPLAEAAPVFVPANRTPGKTIVRVEEGG